MLSSARSDEAFRNPSLTTLRRLICLLLYRSPSYCVQVITSNSHRVSRDLLTRVHVSVSVCSNVYMTFVFVCTRMLVYRFFLELFLPPVFARLLFWSLSFLCLGDCLLAYVVCHCLYFLLCPALVIDIRRVNQLTWYLVCS